MKRALRLTLPAVGSAMLVVAFIACDGERGAPCRVDGDCNTGEICRGEICGAPRPDGGTSDADLGSDTGVSCTNDGIPCTLPAECCSNQCVQNVCGPQPGGNPTCKNQLESCLSTDECCPPYSCTRGLCR
ncbi:MAG: hypothetical protein U0270_12835 [Labilithrix sp.]